MLFTLNSVYATNTEFIDNSSLISSNKKSTNPLDYEPDTEERYIASIAQRLGISFEEAKKINDEEVAAILQKRFKEVGIMAYDEVVKYKTFVINITTSDLY